MRRKIPAKILAPVLALVLISALSVLALAPIDSTSAGAVALSPGAAGEPSCEPGKTCLVTGDFSPVSVNTDTGVTFPSAPAFGALVYDPDFKAIERAAREKLRRGLEVREALSPYRESVDFVTFVKNWDLGAGWDEGYTGTTPYTETLTLIGLIDRADQDLRQARDLYAYLLVYAPAHRFREDSHYITDVHAGYDAPLCGATDKEDPDPPDPAHSGLVLDPVIDWCNFAARLRQSVREAANLRLIFGQQFMVDALGLHFSGTEFYGGEEMVRSELAKLRAAVHQYQLAEQGLAEALGRAVGSGCYVSDFYRQPEWSLLSRAMENQETAQHHIAVRLSYMGIDSPEEVPQVHALAMDAFRQASIDGYVKLIGMAGLGAADPLSAGCAVGERPDGLLAAEMAANLLETRRQAREMEAGRNVFGFDVTFTPARPYKSSVAMDCDTTGPGDRGLWDEAWCAAQYAKELQSDETNNSRAFEVSQDKLRAAVEKIQENVDARITAVSGCSMEGDESVWRPCVEQQVALLRACETHVVITDTNPTTSPFDTCMNDPDAEILNGEAKQALFDLRSIFVDYLGIEIKATNITRRIELSEGRNATVTEWLGISGAAETAARVANAAQLMVNCLKPFDPSQPGSALMGAALNAACATVGGINIAAQATAGALSTAADIEIENAEQYEEEQNLLLDQSELLIDAYAANQHYYAKDAEFQGLLDGLSSDVVEARRQRAYFQHSPANDPSFRIVRDSARMVLAKQLEYAARMSYLAARRAEYEYAARLSASNYRISDIYRARTADDVKRYLTTLLGVTNSLAGNLTYETDPRDFRISVAQHLLLWTDEALAKEGFVDPAAAQAERTRRFRAWVAEHSVDLDGDGQGDELRFSFATSLLDGGLFSRLLRPSYDEYWLLKLSGVGEPEPTNNGVSVNLVTDQTGLSFRNATLTQGGLVHLRSHTGCTFDYRLLAPAVLLGLEWGKRQPPEKATASPLANVNDGHPYTENAFRTSTFLGRAVSSTDWQVVVKAQAPGTPPGLPDMDLAQLTDVELIFSITYAYRTPAEPEPSECTRIDW